MTIELAGDEFALSFDTNEGINPDDLGTLLKRLAKFSRDEGFELTLFDVRHSSKNFLFRWKKKRNRQKRRTHDTNLRSAAADWAQIATLPLLIYQVMSGPSSVSEPACNISIHTQSTINIVLPDQTLAVMTPEEAAEIKQEIQRKKLRPKPQRDEFQTAIAKGQGFEGVVKQLDDELLFQPEGHAYWVPIKPRGQVFQDLQSHHRYVVGGELCRRRGEPEAFDIHWARAVS
ncbi:hypothetical protein H8M03_06220 [Sphingomonas sabuli]|uniref:Uncharacterized protein n=1 Tax=Sphingomonas sabuli TaxID=2764186 RepID=A0A7G9L5K1_9SPHN|nr:hypothetical protein [Sphingomonas sabuli]QNM83900.1 hypothetical protein H8M03_06220 [Sphingomonas sabuli]